MPRKQKNQRSAVMLRHIPITVQHSVLATLPMPSQPASDVVAMVCRNGDQPSTYTVLVAVARGQSGLMERVLAFQKLHGGIVKTGAYGALQGEMFGSRFVLPLPPRSPALPNEVLEPPLMPVPSARRVPAPPSTASLPWLFSAARAKAGVPVQPSLEQAALPTQNAIGNGVALSQTAAGETMDMVGPERRTVAEEGVGAGTATVAEAAKGCSDIEGQSLRDRVPEERGCSTPITSNEERLERNAQAVATDESGEPRAIAPVEDDADAALIASMRGSPFLSSLIRSAHGAEGPQPVGEEHESLARWREVSKSTPTLGAFNFAHLSKDTIKLLEKTLNLADRLPSGRFAWYPPLAVGAIFSGRQLDWIMSRRKRICSFANNVADLQAVSDHFCRDFGLVRMHGSYFVSRLVSTPDLHPSLVQAFVSVPLDYRSRRFLSPVMRRIVTMMSAMPPHWVQHSNVCTVQSLPIHVWLCLLSHAIWDVAHLVLPASRLLEHLNEEGDMVNVGENRCELWRAFTDVQVRPGDMAMVAAAGARPLGSILPEDSPWFDCDRRCKVEVAVDDWPASRNTWAELFEVQALATTDRPTQASIFSVGSQTRPGCVLRFRGRRVLGTHPAENLKARMEELLTGMTPRTAAKAFKHRFFQHVRPIRIAHRFGRTSNGVGPMEIEFHFASASHATMALLLLHRWGHLMQLEDLKLMPFPDEEGEYRMLSALTCTVDVPKAVPLALVLASLGGADLEAAPEAISVLEQEGNVYHLLLRYDGPVVARRMAGKRVRVAGAGGAGLYSSVLVPYVPADPPAACLNCAKMGHVKKDCTQQDFSKLAQGHCVMCRRAAMIGEVPQACSSPPSGTTRQCVIARAYHANALAMSQALVAQWSTHTLFAAENGRWLEQLFAF